MPSPIGHVLAGAAIVWIAAPPPASKHAVRNAGLTLTALGAALAALPDIDLLYQPLHRTASHSLVSAAGVTIVAMAVTGWVTPASGAVRVGLICGAAWASHLLLDWMGTDNNSPRGIQLLWPVSERWFISGWDFFPPTERRDPLSAAALAKNAWAAVYELAILGAFAAAAWWSRTPGRRAGKPGRAGGAGAAGPPGSGSAGQRSSQE